MSKPTVYKINYDLNGSNWSAVILSTNQELAIKAIQDVVKATVKVNTIETKDKIDLISKEVNTEVITEKIVEVIVSNEENKSSQYKCPWCDAEHETSKGLIVHIGKNHAKAEKKK